VSDEIVCLIGTLPHACYRNSNLEPERSYWQQNREEYLPLSCLPETVHHPSCAGLTKD